MLSNPPLNKSVYSSSVLGCRETISIRRDAALCWLFALTWIAFGAFVGFDDMFSLKDVWIDPLDWRQGFEFQLKLMLALLHPYCILGWTLFAIERTFARLRTARLKGNEDHTDIVLRSYFVITVSTLIAPVCVALGVAYVAMNKDRFSV